MGSRQSHCALPFSPHTGWGSSLLHPFTDPWVGPPGTASPVKAEEVTCRELDMKKDPKTPDPATLGAGVWDFIRLYTPIFTIHFENPCFSDFLTQIHRALLWISAATGFELSPWQDPPYVFSQRKARGNM